MHNYLLFSLFIFTSFSIEAASFNCENAKKPTDITICSDQTLSDLDSENMNLYKLAKALDASQAKEILKQSIASKYKCEMERDCIEGIYRQTILLYSAIINSSKENVISNVYRSPAVELSRTELFSRAKSAYQSGDFDSAILLVRPLAERGDAEAELSLGVVYERGKQDYVEAMKWYKLAAEQENSTAQFIIGSMYLKGIAVAVNKDIGINWIQLAADNGLATASDLLKQLAEKNILSRIDVKRITADDELPDTKLVKINASKFLIDGNTLTKRQQFNETLVNSANSIAVKPVIAEELKRSDLEPLKQTNTKDLGFSHTPLIDVPKDKQINQTILYLWLFRIVLIISLIFLYRFFRKL